MVDRLESFLSQFHTIGPQPGAVVERSASANSVVGTKDPEDLEIGRLKAKYVLLVPVTRTTGRPLKSVGDIDRLLTLGRLGRVVGVATAIRQGNQPPPQN